MSTNHLEALALMPDDATVPIRWLREAGLLSDSPPTDRWVSLTDAATRLKLSVSHTRALFADGEVPGADKKRGRWGILESDLDRYDRSRGGS